VVKNHPNPEQIASLLDVDPVFQRLLELDLVENIDYLTGIVSVICPFGHEHLPGLSVYVPAGVLGRRDAGYHCLHGACEGRGIEDLITVAGLTGWNLGQIRELTTGHAA
jgi:hypothetical protein